MRLAPEGHPFVWPAVVVTLTLWALPFAGVGEGSWWLPALALLSTVTAGFVLFFFRDPRPAGPRDPNVVVAPGQGRVVEITEVEEASFMEGPARRISIFLSIFDVHVQRAPVSGRVGHYGYRSGAFVAAWSSQASDANEQASLGIRTPGGPVLVRQIAGLVARRIVTDPREGDQVERGERIGLIRFGSRVDTFLPLSWPVTCRVGEKAVAGVTALARMPGEEASHPTEDASNGEDPRGPGEPDITGRESG